ncbi:MAG TPA: hypothetical protein VFC93_09635 [Chloroflexota bacterium]|nr:hypothetical protein [Chloroflexota bacterium]
MFDEAQARLERAVLTYVLAEGQRAGERAVADVAVAHPHAVGACGLAGDLLTTLRMAVDGSGAERTLAVLRALSMGAEPDQSRPAVSISLAVVELPGVN